jgi:hypothetical protein
MEQGQPQDDGWEAAQAALKAAQNLPSGPARFDALRKAGQLRFAADEKRRALRELDGKR